MKTLRGHVWKFGDNINTDLMMPGFTLRGMGLDEAKKYCMHANRPEFAGQVQPGDVIVGGKNFGCGSSRPAPDVLIALGVSCILAESAGGIFYRNCINSGLPIITQKDLSNSFEEGDEVEVFLETGYVKSLQTGKTISIPSFPPELQAILDAGGILNVIKR